MEKKLISSIEEHIDAETPVTHSQLAEEMDELLESSEKLADLLKNPKVWWLQLAVMLILA